MNKKLIIKLFKYLLEKKPFADGLQVEVDVTVDVLQSTFVLFMFSDGSNS